MRKHCYKIEVEIDNDWAVGCIYQNWCFSKWYDGHSHANYDMYSMIWSVYVVIPEDEVGELVHWFVEAGYKVSIEEV